MLRKRLLWITQCLLFCLAGIFVSGQLSGLLNPLVWWALHQSRNTFLERSSFVATYYLPLIGIYGFCLGLIPIHRLKELLASFFGKIEFRSNPEPELVCSRPLLWAWAPVGLLLVIRFLTFSTKADQSVLFFGDAWREPLRTLLRSSEPWLRVRSVHMDFRPLCPYWPHAVSPRLHGWCLVASSVPGATSQLPIILSSRARAPLGTALLAELERRLGRPIARRTPGGRPWRSRWASSSICRNR